MELYMECGHNYVKKKKAKMSCIDLLLIGKLAQNVNGGCLWQDALWEFENPSFYLWLSCFFVVVVDRENG